MKRFIKIITFILVFIICTIGITDTSFAKIGLYDKEDHDYDISLIDTSIYVSDSNIYSINEKITVEHYNNEQLCKVIPLIYDGIRRSVINVKVENASGKYVIYKTVEKGSNLYVYFNNEKSEACETFKISYEYNMGYDYDESKDMFYFDLVGKSWEEDIQKVKFAVTFPAFFDVRKMKIYSSTLNDDNLCVTSFAGKTIRGETKDVLPAGNNLIVTFKFDNGFFKENKSLNNYILDYGIYVIEGLLALFLIILIMNKISINRINKYNPLTKKIKFEDIKKLKLNPMEISYITNNGISSKDVLAMFYYWQSKKYVTVKKINRDYEIEFKVVFIKGHEYEVQLYNYFYDFAQNKILYLSCIGTDFDGVFKGTMHKVVNDLIHNKKIFTYKYRLNGIIFRFVSLFLFSCLLGITTYKFLGIKASFYEGTFVSFVFINLFVKGVFAILEKDTKTPSLMKGINLICSVLAIIVFILIAKEIPNIMIYNYSRFNLLKIFLIVASFMYIFIICLSFNEVPFSKYGVEVKNNLLSYKNILRESKNEYTTEDICYALSLDVEPLIITNKELINSEFMQFSGEKIHIEK